MAALTMEALEVRRLLSTSLVESEPNNSAVRAAPIPRHLEQQVEIRGAIGEIGDRDWFRIKLEAGDVVGAAMTGEGGLDTVLRLVSASGKLMMGNDDHGLAVLPAESPLPRADAVLDSAIYYVINKPGTYYLEASAFEDAGAGNYDLDLVVARPGMEAKPLGARQILFLDFDGAKIDFNTYLYKDPGKQTFGPLVDALPSWGLSAADENAVIDAIIRVVTDKLSTRVTQYGANRTAGIDIRNSRDDRDEFGKNPLVSRVTIGTIGPDFPEFYGTAQDIDVGNFKTNDEAAAAVDWFAGALGNIGIDPSWTVIDVAGAAFGTVIAHEMGHLLGCFHTDLPSLFEGTPSLMDGSIDPTLGPDFIAGTKDDLDVQFVVDAFASNEPFEGVNDTLNTVSYGLSVGGSVAVEPPHAVRVEAMSRPAAAGLAILSSLEREEAQLLT